MMKIKFIFLITVLTGILFAESGDMDYPDKLLKQYKETTSEVISKLSDNSIWEDTNKRDGVKREFLEEYLMLASILKCENVEKILVKHISYGSFLSPIKLPHKCFPVRTTLCSIGIKSVNPLIELIKTIDPRDRAARLKTVVPPSPLSTASLIMIYAQGGYEQKMTRQRFLLEIERATGIEKAYLEMEFNSLNSLETTSPNHSAMFNPLPESYKKDADMIISKLSSEDTWENAVYTKDETKTEILLKYLELAYTLRCGNIENELVKHITYRPFEGQKVKDITIESQYPVYNTLCQIGIRAVGPLVNLLKTDDLDKKTQDLIIRCLVNIYEQGGFGKEMTKYRLQLENEELKGKDKELIEKALQHPQLNTEKK